MNHDADFRDQRKIRQQLLSQVIGQSLDQFARSVGRDLVNSGPNGVIIDRLRDVVIEAIEGLSRTEAEIDFQGLRVSPFFVWNADVRFYANSIQPNRHANLIGCFLNFLQIATVQKGRLIKNNRAITS